MKKTKYENAMGDCAENLTKVKKTFLSTTKGKSPLSLLFLNLL